MRSLMSITISPRSLCPVISQASAISSLTLCPSTISFRTLCPEGISPRARMIRPRTLGPKFPRRICAAITIARLPAWSPAPQREGPRGGMGRRGGARWRKRRGSFRGWGWMFGGGPVNYLSSWNKNSFESRRFVGDSKRIRNILFMIHIFLFAFGEKLIISIYSNLNWNQKHQ